MRTFLIFLTIFFSSSCAESIRIETTKFIRTIQKDADIWKSYQESNPEPYKMLYKENEHDYDQLARSYDQRQKEVLNFSFSHANSYRISMYLSEWFELLDELRVVNTNENLFMSSQGSFDKFTRILYILLVEARMSRVPASTFNFASKSISKDLFEVFHRYQDQRYELLQSIYTFINLINSSEAKTFAMTYSLMALHKFWLKAPQLREFNASTLKALKNRLTEDENGVLKRYWNCSLHEDHLDRHTWYEEILMRKWHASQSKLYKCDNFMDYLWFHFGKKGLLEITNIQSNPHMIPVIKLFYELNLRYGTNVFQDIMIVVIQYIADSLTYLHHDSTMPQSLYMKSRHYWTYSTHDWTKRISPKILMTILRMYETE